MEGGVYHLWSSTGGGVRPFFFVGLCVLVVHEGIAVIKQ